MRRWRAQTNISEREGGKGQEGGRGIPLHYTVALESCAKVSSFVTLDRLLLCRPRMRRANQRGSVALGGVVVGIGLSGCVLKI